MRLNTVGAAVTPPEPEAEPEPDEPPELDDPDEPPELDDPDEPPELDDPDEPPELDDPDEPPELDDPEFPPEPRPVPTVGRTVPWQATKNRPENATAISNRQRFTAMMTSGVSPPAAQKRNRIVQEGLMKGTKVIHTPAFRDTARCESQKQTTAHKKLHHLL